MSKEAEVRDAFAKQEKACAALGSPFTARLMRLTGRRLNRSTDIGRLVLDWPGDPANTADSVPLRLAGALHALVLNRQGTELIAVYPPNDGSLDDNKLWDAVIRALKVHTDFIRDWMQSPPQTNEVRRSNGIFPGLTEVAKISGVSKLSILELGASAGLNLACDRFAYDFAGRSFGDPTSLVRLAPQWRGDLPPLDAFTIVGRAGCDLNPLDVRDEADMIRLRAYTWTDQADRLERLDQAAAIARVTLPAGSLARADAADWLVERLKDSMPGATTVIYHTIAWQYFPAETAQRCEAAISDAARRSTSDAPLAWLAIEADGQSGAAVRLRVWPAGFDKVIARMDFHGRWVEWLG